MKEDRGEDLLRQKPSFVGSFFKRLGQTSQKFLDESTPHVVPRWVALGIFTVLYLTRILVLKGWYIVTYALAIYHLNLLLAFLTPKIDPAMELDDEDGDGMELPTRQSDEFRPFIGRLPEFKYWYSATKATVIAFFCTLFEFFNIPIFWPVLVMSFIILFCITMWKWRRRLSAD